MKLRQPSPYSERAAAPAPGPRPRIFAVVSGNSPDPRTRQYAWRFHRPHPSGVGYQPERLLDCGGRRFGSRAAAKRAALDALEALGAACAVEWVDWT